MDSVLFPPKITPNHLLELHPWLVLENPNSDHWLGEACFSLKRLLDPRILLLHLVVNSEITPDLPPNKDRFQRLQQAVEACAVLSRRSRVPREQEGSFAK